LAPGHGELSRYLIRLSEFSVISAFGAFKWGGERWDIGALIHKATRRVIMIQFRYLSFDFLDDTMWTSDYWRSEATRGHIQ